MNSDRRLPLGDVIRLVVVAILLAWLIIFSIPAAAVSEGGILGSILGSPSSAQQMSLLAAAPLPAAAPAGPTAQLAIPTIEAVKAASGPTNTPMPTIAPGTPTPTRTNTPLPSNTPLPTNTPTRTPIPSNTPTRTPVPPTSTPRPPTATPVPPTPTPVPPPPIAWDGRLAFLRVGIAAANVAPGQQYWRVVRGVFQDWNEGGNGHSIYVDVIDEAGNRIGLGEGTEIGLVNWGEQDTLRWGAKPPNESPVNYPMYGGLGAYKVWLTLGGLPSEQVYGMGLVATDSEANLLAQPGKVHVQYLLTFQRATK